MKTPTRGKFRKMLDAYTRTMKPREAMLVIATDLYAVLEMRERDEQKAKTNKEK